MCESVLYASIQGQVCWLEGNFLIFKPKPNPIHSQNAETPREENIWICSLTFLFLHVSLNIRFKTLDSTLDF